ncbi:MULTISPECIES: quinoprotein relay system zinc metallohydrolase 2 [unclassified Methylophaga]|jgi:quinoprotein relay system zinc metallohydrolase 2|uniref:quinoprotein relay system zinc metallohydrolase 2 n=2 Tax=Methylophaga TaxID=40222 RepID=UPI000C686815|nr:MULTISPECIES: quinoprotein relay system zinc metallohydrolase 2 [unclassified Methylophaga]MAL48606.1 MBL fold metallo-hydrolase [Methylophaga sp.]MBP26325.1 MBL fold metallo-hydrolase [Methylophaga sp.]|tara:strand:+ start:1672 stop:2604 length:933 start_codon:yes stop_codon:yes gene_type:complete
MRILISFLSITVSSFAFASSLQADNYKVQQVAEGVFYHQGSHEEADAKNLGAIANVGFIIGEQCIAVIDSGGSFQEGKLLRKTIRQHSDLPICYVINTHVHPDHVLGNAAFKTDKPEFVGHEKLPAAMASRQQHFARQFSEILGDAYKGTEFIEAKTLVKVGSPLTLDLGNRPLILTAFTTAHTDHDLTVYDEKTSTLWTGDLLFVERIPALDGSINGWIDALDTLIEHDATMIIPGHGTAFNGENSKGWQDLLRYLTTVREEIRVIINDLGTIEQAIDSVGTQEAEKWKLFEEYHRRNVTAAFVELEWE